MNIFTENFMEAVKRFEAMPTYQEPDINEALETRLLFDGMQNTCLKRKTPCSYLMQINPHHIIQLLTITVRVI